MMYACRTDWLYRPPSVGMWLAILKVLNNSRSIHNLRVSDFVKNIGNGHINTKTHREHKTNTTQPRWNNGNQSQTYKPVVGSWSIRLERLKSTRHHFLCWRRDCLWRKKTWNYDHINKKHVANTKQTQHIRYETMRITPGHSNLL